MNLSAEEARIVGALIEKQLTTPQYYPLTLHALVGACNQTSNRDPVVDYPEHMVESAVASLRDRRLVRYVLPSHGRSVVRYRQVLDETLGLDDRQLALLAVLLLRGPQTLGELRGRTERMAEFDSVESVEHDLGTLAASEDAMVERLPRRPGQKEERWIHRLGEDDREGWSTSAPGPRDRVDPDLAGSATPETTSAAPSPHRDQSHLARRVEELGAEVSDLRGEVTALRSALEDLQASLGG